MRKGRLVPKMSKAMRSSSLDDIKRYVKPLDQYQTGRIVKRYTDPSEFLGAFKAAEDSAFAAHEQQNIFENKVQSGDYDVYPPAKHSVADPAPIIDYDEAYNKALSKDEAEIAYGNITAGNTLGYSNYRGINPVGYLQAVNNSTTGPFTRIYPMYKPPVVTPILSESMESIPVKSPTRLQVKPLQEITPVTRDVGTATQPFIQPQKYTASKYLQTQGKPTGYINKGDNKGRIDVYQKGGLPKYQTGISERYYPKKDIHKLPPKFFADPKQAETARDNTNAPIIPLWDISHSQQVQEAAKKDIKTGEGALEWNRNWINSPMHKEMLTGELQNAPEDYSVEQYTKKRLKNISDIDVIEHQHNHPEEGESLGGRSYRSTGKIELYPARDMLTGVHEVSHSSDRPYSIYDKFKEKRLIPSSSIKKIDRYRWNQGLKGNFYDVNAASDKDLTIIEKEDKEWADYVAKPTETRARLNSIRAAAQKIGIYDPFTEKLSKEKMLQLIKNQESLTDKQGFNPYSQLQDIFTDEEIRDMLNTISYENSSDNVLPQARYGGLYKYQKGGQVVTDYDKDWDYKKEEGTVYTRKKGSDNWIAPKKGSVAERAIQRKIFGSPTKEEEAVQMKIPQTPVLDIRMPEVTGDTVPSPRRVPIAPRKVDPEVTIGDFLPDLPDVSLPKVQMPEVSRPKISLPDMPDMPKVSMPDISLPDVEAPKVSMPDMPDMDIPNLELYENLERDAGRIKGIVKDLGEYGEEFTDYAKDVISDAVSSGKSNLNALKNFFKGELKDYAEDFVGRAKDIEDSVDNAIDKVKSLPELLKNISDVEEEIVEKGPAPSPVVPKPIAEVEDKETFEEMLVRAANNLNTGHILAGDQMYRVEDGKLTKRMETIVGRTTSARKGAPSELSYAATLEKNWYNADGSLREFETLEGLKTGPEIEEEGLAEKYSGTTPAGIYEFTNQPVKAYEKLGYSSYLKGVGETPDPTTRTYFTNEKGERQYVHSSTAYHPYPGEKAKAIRDKALKDLNISNELSGSCLQNMDCDNRDMGILLNSNPSFRDSLIILNPNMGALSAEAVRQLAVEFDLAQSKKEQEDILKLLAGNK